MIQLGKNRVNGGFPISATPDAPTLLLRTNENAGTPAEISVFNNDAAAIVYLKWKERRSGGGGISTTNAGTVLKPFCGYTWANPPRDSELIALSTVANSSLAVDANWQDVEAVS